MPAFAQRHPRDEEALSSPRISVRSVSVIGARVLELEKGLAFRETVDLGRDLRQLATA
jgi:hypothetical protein